MSCGCPACRLHDRALAAIAAGDAPTDPDLRAEVAAIWQGWAENAEAEARTALDFASADDRFGFDERAAMFRGIAFKARERAHDIRHLYAQFA